MAERVPIVKTRDFPVLITGQACSITHTSVHIIGCVLLIQGVSNQVVTTATTTTDPWTTTGSTVTTGTGQWTTTGSTVTTSTEGPLTTTGSTVTTSTGPWTTTESTVTTSTEGPWTTTGSTVTPSTEGPLTTTKSTVTTSTEAPWTTTKSTVTTGTGPWTTTESTVTPSTEGPWTTTKSTVTTGTEGSWTKTGSSFTTDTTPTYITQRVSCLYPNKPWTFNATHLKVQPKCLLELGTTPIPRRGLVIWLELFPQKMDIIQWDYEFHHYDFQYWLFYNDEMIYPYGQKEWYLQIIYPGTIKYWPEVTYSLPVISDPPKYLISYETIVW